ncbi:MAG: M16 family metallopeptidase [Bacteroidota bacterium]
MLNRLIAPNLLQPGGIEIPAAQITSLSNQTPVITLNSGTQEVIKIELVFEAGSIYSSHPILATSCNRLIEEGSGPYTSAEISEMLDQYGAYFITESGNEFANISLYTTGKFILQTLPVLKTILSEPTFAEEEIETFKTQGKQRLAINLNKVDFLARRNFLNTLYGNEHPLGILTQPDDFDKLNKSVLSSFYESHYRKKLKAVFIAGKLSSEQETAIYQLLEDLKFDHSNTKNNVKTNILNSKSLYINKKDSVQAAIRIGKRMFTRTHPDYYDFTILNTILGGYFGSRLMSNIREDKGYTYGIGSGLATDINDGYFFISTEVGATVVNEALKEIYFETERLQNELVPEEELTLVKNYLFGSFQRSIDGVFALSDRHKTLYLNNLTTDHYLDYIHRLKTITSEDIQFCAQKHLVKSTFSEVIVGP